MDIKKILMMNGINIILLVLIIILYFLFPVYIVLPLGFVWLIYVLRSNYIVIVTDNDIIEALKASNKRHLFDSQVAMLETTYNSIKSREDVFGRRDEKTHQVYEMIVKQSENNILQSIEFMKAYDYISKPKADYLNSQVQENIELRDKLNQLVEMLVNIETSVHDVDTSYLDDLLESLKNVQKGNF